MLFLVPCPCFYWFGISWLSYWLCRTLLDARVKIGKMDDGARIHVVSQLIQETMDIAKSMLAASMVEKGKKPESTISESSVQGLLQRDRVVAAVQLYLIISKLSNQG